jgi:hypothetical protein
MVALATTVATAKIAKIFFILHSSALAPLLNARTGVWFREPEIGEKHVQMVSTQPDLPVRR